MPIFKRFLFLLVLLGLSAFADDGSRSYLYAVETAPLSLEAPKPSRGSNQLSALTRAFGDQATTPGTEKQADAHLKEPPSFKPVAQSSLGRTASQAVAPNVPIRTASTRAEDFDETSFPAALPSVDGVETDELPHEPAAIDSADSTETDGVLGQVISFGNRAPGDAKLAKPSLSGAFAPLVSIVGSLLIVLAAFMLLMTLMKKISPKGNRILPAEVFEDLGRSHLTQKLQVHLLRVGNRLVLVSVTQDGITPIMEVTEPDEVVPIIATCRGQDKSSSSNLFKRTLTELSKTDSGDYFGSDEPIKATKTSATVSKSVTAKPAKQAKPATSSLLDLYSEPDESLAEILASGLTGKGAKHA